MYRSKYAWAYYLASVIVVVICLALLFSGCSDHDAKSDLAKDSQKLNVADVDVAVMPDGFPNVSHKCVAYDAGPPVGMFTTTDRFLVIVYNDHACPNSNVEQEMTVINAGSRLAVLGG